MKLYVCDWENGERTVVYAESKEDAVYRLDELAGAAVAQIREWPKDAFFFVGFEPYRYLDEASEEEGGDSISWHPSEDNEISEHMADEDSPLGDAKAALALFEVPEVPTVTPTPGSHDN